MKSDLLPYAIALITTVAVALTGGPTWAVFGFGYLGWLIVRYR